MKLIKLCVFTILIFSCNKNEPLNNTVRLAISSSDYQKEVKLSSVIKEAKYIPLETKNECLMGGRIKKIIIEGDKIYIHELNANSIFIFDIHGNFLFKINKQGKGPGEFISINDFQVNKVTGFISILDGTSVKINYYDARGEFIHELKFKYRCISYAEEDSFIYLDRANAGFSDPEQQYNYNVYIINKKGELIGNYLPTKKYLESFTFIANSPFLKYNNSINYQGVFDNNIYSFKEDSMTVKYKLDFGKKWPDKEFFTKLLSLNTNNPQIYYNELRDNGYILHANFFEANNYIHVYFYENDIVYNVFYSKKTKEFKGFRLDSYIDDIEGVGFGRVYNTINDEQFVCAIQAQDAIENIKKSGIQNSTINITEMDNPILLLFTLNNF